MTFFMFFLLLILVVRYINTHKKINKCTIVIIDDISILVDLAYEKHESIY